MDLKLADRAYETGLEGGAEVICHNMYSVGTNDVEGRSFELKSSPGLEVFAQMGSLVRGFHAQDGLFDGDIICVAGDQVKRVSSTGAVTTLGSVPATGDVTIAASRIEMAICVEPNLYICNGSSVVQVTDPDLPNVTSVDHINQRFIVSDDSDRYYWSDILDGSSWEGLNFATAEASPDELRRVVSDGERFYAMGTTTTEHIGAVTNPSSSTQAFTRVGSGVLKSGVAGRYAMALDKDSKTLAFVGHEDKIYLTNGYELQEISTPFIRQEIAKATPEDHANTRCFTFALDGEIFFVANIPNVGTYVFNKEGRRFHTRDTFGSVNWRAKMAVSAWGKTYVADTEDSRIFEMCKSVLSDVGEPISKEFSASVPIRGRSALSDLILDGYASGASIISMRTSDDGRVWGSFVDRDMTHPDLNSPPVWRRLGKALPPKRLFHFRCTDDVNLTIRGARMNDEILR